MKRNKYKITPVEILSDSKINIRFLGEKPRTIPLRKGDIIGLDHKIVFPRSKKIKFGDKK